MNSDDFFCELPEDDIMSSVGVQEIDDRDENYDYEFILSVNTLKVLTINNIKRIIQWSLDNFIPDKMKCVSVDVINYNSNAHTFDVVLNIKCTTLDKTKDVFDFFRAICILNRNISVYYITYKQKSSKKYNHIRNISLLAVMFGLKEKRSIAGLRFSPAEINVVIWDFFILCKIFLQYSDSSSEIKHIYNDVIMYADLLNKCFYNSDSNVNLIDYIINENITYDKQRISEKAYIYLDLASLAQFKICWKCECENVPCKPSYKTFCSVINEYHSELDIRLSVTAIDNEPNIKYFFNIVPPIEYYDISWLIENINSEYYDTTNLGENLYICQKPTNVFRVSNMTGGKSIIPEHVRCFVDKLDTILSNKHFHMKYKCIVNSNMHMILVLSVGCYIDRFDNIYVGTYSLSGPEDIVKVCMKKLGILY